MYLQSLNSENNCRQVPLQVNVLDDDTFILTSMSLIFLWDYSYDLREGLKGITRLYNCVLYITSVRTFSQWAV